MEKIDLICNKVSKKLDLELCLVKENVKNCFFGAPYSISSEEVAYLILSLLSEMDLKIDESLITKDSFTSIYGLSKVVTN
jgi:hypothetical protein